MSNTARRVSWLGVFLILFGVLLLMRKFGVINVHLREIVWPLLILVGILLTARGFSDGSRGRIVFGTILFLYSIFFFMRTVGDIYIPIDMFFPATLMIFGIVMFMLFVNKPAEWYFLIPALFLFALGTLIVMSEYGYWYYWEMSDELARWWPAVLILFGAGLLLRRRGSTRASAGVSAVPHDSSGTALQEGQLEQGDSTGSSPPAAPK